MPHANQIWESIVGWTMLYGAEIAKILILVVVGIWFINKLCRVSTAFLRKTNLDIGLISFISSAFKFFLRALLILLVLSALGVNMTSAIAAIGASFVTVGLVLKDSLSNFINGILLIVNKPIRVGDYIEFEGIKGTVTKIEMTFTTVTSENGFTAAIPNFRLMSGNIIRKSPYDICECSFEFLASGSKDEPNLKKILNIFFISDERILQIPPPDVKYKLLDKNKFNIKVIVFCEKRHLDAVKQETPQNLKAILKKHGVEVKYN